MEDLKKIKIEDGIINLDMWNKANVKVLFILKESYGNLSVNGEATYSLIKYITKNGARGNTFKPCARFLFNLQTNEGEYNDLIKSSAFVNIIKDNGNNKRTKWKNLRLSYEQNKFELIEQIKEISPSIIVFGNTYYLFQETFKELPNLNHNEAIKIFDENSIFNNMVVCCCFHPVRWKIQITENFADAVSKQYFFSHRR